MKNNKVKIIILLFLIALTMLLTYFLMSKTTERASFWPQETQKYHENPSFLIDSDVFSDFFEFERYRGIVQHHIRLKGAGPGQWSKDITKLFKSMALEHNNGPKTPQIESNFIDEFLITAQEVASQDYSKQTVSTHLYFTPFYSIRPNQDVLFHKYQLDSLQNRGSLSRNLDFESLTFPQKIFTIYTPTDGDRFQYSGGVISAYFQEDGTTLLRKRRYFRINHRSDLELNLRENDLFTLEYTHLDLRRAHSFYLTVDLEFTLEQDEKQKRLLPIDRSLIVYPGFLLDPNIDFRPNDILHIQEQLNHQETGELNLRMRYQRNIIIAQIKKIHYSLDKENFQPDKSIINFDFRNLAASSDLNNPIKRGAIQQKIKEILFQDNAAEVYRAFYLHRFTPQE